MKKCIAILIADFELDKLKEIEKSHTKWNIREEEFSKYILTNVCEIHIIELPKIKKYVRADDIVHSSKREEKIINWGKFLISPKELGESDMENDEALKKAKEEYDAISEDEHEKYLAELRLKHIMDSKAIERYGYRKGKEEGIEEGIEQGAKRKEIEIAKEMIKNGEDIEKICKYTSLTKEKILKLKI